MALGCLVGTYVLGRSWSQDIPRRSNCRKENTFSAVVNLTLG